MARLHAPSELDLNDLVALVETIQNTLWPDGDRDAHWDPSTIEAIAGALQDAGLGPDYTNNP